MEGRKEGRKEETHRGGVKNVWYLLFSLGLLIEAVDEDLSKVIQLLKKFVNWLRLSRLVLRVNWNQTRNQGLLLGD